MRQKKLNWIDTAEVLPTVSKVAGVWRSLSWCHAVPDIMGLTNFGDKRINDLGLLRGYVLGRTTSWSPTSQCVYGPENKIAAVTFLRKMAQL